MNTVDKLNNVLGWLTAMNFDNPELSNYLEEPLNVLSEAISEVENMAIHSFVVPKGTLCDETESNRQGSSIATYTENSKPENYA